MNKNSHLQPRNAANSSINLTTCDHVEKSTLAARHLKNLWQWAIAMHGSYKSKFVTNIFYYFLHMLIKYIWTKYILLSILSGLLLSYGMYVMRIQGVRYDGKQYQMTVDVNQCITGLRNQRISLWLHLLIYMGTVLNIATLQ